MAPSLNSIKKAGWFMKERVEEWREMRHSRTDLHWYEVSNLGRVRAVRIMTPFKTWRSAKVDHAGKANKYRLAVSLRTGSKKKRGHPVHRLVAEVFCEKPPGKTDVNHIDGNCINNRANNLEWVTPEENNRHALANKLHARGSAVFNNKIDPQVAIKMRLEGKTFAEIGARFGASLQAARFMLKRMGADWPIDGKPTKRRRPRNNRYTIEEALALRNSGHSWLSIASTFGVSPDAVRRRLEKRGLS